MPLHERGITLEEGRNMNEKSRKSTYLGLIMMLTILAIAGYFLTVDAENPLLPKATAQAEIKLKQLPDFSEYQDVKEKKEAFFSTLYPIIQEENQHILNIRDAVVRLEETKMENLTQEEIEWLAVTANHYGVKAQSTDNDFFQKLLMKVDYIPPSLVLAQAAIESGWGSSRFSKEGNNLFGQWCFKRGCGMVPSARDDDKAHEVATFKTVNQSVRAYLKNLNTNQSYKSLRQLRANIRAKNEMVKGKALAVSLTKYSEEGPMYVQKLTRFIEQNELQRFSQAFEQSMIASENL